MRSTWFAAVVSCLVLSCDPTAEKTCTGETRSCTCDDGSTARQSCNKDGTDWQTCPCPGNRDAGVADVNSADQSTNDRGPIDEPSVDASGPRPQDAAIPDHGAADLMARDVARPDGSFSVEDAAEIDASVPILERPTDPVFSCTEELAPWFVTDCLVGVPAASPQGFFLANTGGFATGASLRLDLIGLDLIGGGNSSPTEIAQLSSAFVYGIGYEQTMAYGNNALAVIWVETSEDHAALYAALFDAQGQLILAPHEVDGTLNNMITRPVLLGTATGFVAMWLTYKSADTASLAMVEFDANLVQQSPPHIVMLNFVSLIGGRPANQELLALSERGGGYAVAWSEADRVLLLLLTPDGEAAGPRRVISRPEYSAARSPRLLLYQNELFATWSEHTRDDIRASSIVMLAKVNQQDGSVTVRHQLQSHQVGYLNVQPFLVELEGGLGLYWSTGPWSSWSSDSYGQNELRFLALDPARLAPTSNVVVQSQNAFPAGLFRPLAVRRGELLMCHMNFSFHATTNCGLASIRCAR